MYCKDYTRRSWYDDFPVFAMTRLEQVKDFASKAHEGQTRKYENQPFIVHPIRVMELCREYTEDITILSAALLHDVLEDTEVSEDDLYTFLSSVMEKTDSEKTVRMVLELTDVFIKADYPSWNRRKRRNKEADRIQHTSGDSQTVKYADIIDNCTEIARHWEDDFSEKFLKECRSLLKRIDKGHPQLYQRAIQVVNDGLIQIQDLKRQYRGD